MWLVLLVGFLGQFWLVVGYTSFIYGANIRTKIIRGGYRILGRLGGHFKVLQK